jgi:hypothetical protein
MARAHLLINDSGDPLLINDSGYYLLISSEDAKRPYATSAIGKHFGTTAVTLKHFGTTAEIKK